MSRIDIHNVRLGFATNSSSTHSIIFLRDPSDAQDNDVDGENFGWDFWTAASKEAKLSYLGQTLIQDLCSSMPKEAAVLVAQDWLGVKLNPDGYVDHQSIYTFPMEWDGKMVSREFVEDFKNFLLQEKVAILGGNDNTEESHPLSGSDVGPPIAVEGYPTTVARKDSRGYWTVFDRQTGTKVRFAFDAPGEKLSPKKSDAPELVDVKITNKCPYGCTYCYQASVPTGKHSSKQYLESLVFALKDLKVFEIAIGGGEPTISPDFMDLLEKCVWNGIVPNFTTRNLDWFRDDAHRNLFFKTCGAFAYSIDTSKDVEKLAKLTQDWTYQQKEKVAIQYVVGVGHDGFELGSILRAAKEHSFTITLLGYKTNGRGADVKPLKQDWLDTLVRMNKDKGLPYRLGIDTALVAEAGDKLKKAGISDRLYTAKEGAFSCYIDAVTGKIGPSSYCEDSQMLPLETPSRDEIKKAFASF